MRFITFLAVLLAAVLPSLAFAEPHKLAIQVDQDDPKVIAMALNNAANVASHYQAKGEDVVIEIVAYGPGLMMFRDDKSPVKSRISAMSLELPNLRFAACGNTLHAMSKAEGIEVPLMSEAEVVPSGVVRLMELQEEGYSYVRP